MDTDSSGTEYKKEIFIPFLPGKRAIIIYSACAVIILGGIFFMVSKANVNKSSASSKSPTPPFLNLFDTNNPDQQNTAGESTVNEQYGPRKPSPSVLLTPSLPAPTPILTSTPAPQNTLTPTSTPSPTSTPTPTSTPSPTSTPTASPSATPVFNITPTSTISAFPNPT